MNGKLALGAALLLLLTACGAPQASRGESELEGVTLRTGQERYPQDVEKVDALWQNDAGEDINIGAPFELERESGGTWTAVEGEQAFLLPAYEIPAGESRPWSYSLEAYSPLEPGRYRIKTDCSIFRVNEAGGSENDRYLVTAEFQIG